MSVWTLSFYDIDFLYAHPPANDKIERVHHCRRGLLPAACFVSQTITVHTKVVHSLQPSGYHSVLASCPPPNKNPHVSSRIAPQ